MGGGGEEGMFDGIVDYKVQMPSRMFESGSYVVAVRRSNYIRSIVIVQIYLFYQIEWHTDVMLFLITTVKF